MILPLRVLGRPGANWIASGEAIAPISLRTHWRSCVRKSSSPSSPAVVGMPHEIKGQGIYAFVTLNAGEEGDDDLRTQLRQWVRKEIGPIASPDAIQFAPGLPKTRSGKIMRRILRKIAENDTGNLGDISTLADPGVVASLVENRVG